MRFPQLSILCAGLLTLVPGLSRLDASDAPLPVLSGPGLAAGTFPVAITFPSAVTGFTTQDVVVTNGSVVQFSGSNASYTATVEPIGTGAVGISIPAAVCVDGNGVSNLAANTSVPASLSSRDFPLAFGDRLWVSFPQYPMAGDGPTQFMIDDLTTSVRWYFDWSTTASHNPNSITGTGDFAQVTGSKIPSSTMFYGLNNTGSTHPMCFRSWSSFHPFTVSERSSGAALWNMASSTFIGRRLFVSQIINGDTLRITLDGGAFSSVSIPTATLSAGAGSVVGPFDISVVFSEAVSGFSASDLAVTGGTVQGITGTGAAYVATIAPDPTKSSVSVVVPAGVAKSVANLGNQASAALVRAVDLTPPVITFGTPSSSTGTFDLPITLSRVVSGFSSSDLQLVNGTVVQLVGSDLTYTATVEPATSGLVGFTIPSGSCLASNGLGNAEISGTTAVSLSYRDFPLAFGDRLWVSFPQYPVVGDGPTQFMIDDLATSVRWYFDWSTTASHNPNSITGTGDFAQVTGSKIPSSTMFYGLNNTGSTHPMCFRSWSSFHPFTVSERSSGAALWNMDGSTFIGRRLFVSRIINGDTLRITLDGGAFSGMAIPSVTLSSGAGPMVGGAFDISVVFSEAVNGFSAADLVISGGTVGGVSGSGAAYVVSIIPNLNLSDVTVSVPAGVAKSVANMGNTAGAPLTRLVAKPPVITIAAPQSIVLPGTTALGAAVTDPNGLPVNSTWTQLSGPAVATLATPGALSSQVSFPLDGFYQFRLTAGNGFFTTNATTTVIASLSGCRVVDNGTPGYSESGAWNTSSITGAFASTTRLNKGVASASWVLDGEPGWFQVDAWVVGAIPLSSTGANYKVTHADGSQVTTINLTTTAAGWRTLGWYRRGAAPITVELTGAGTLRADAVRTIALGGTIIDDTAAGFSQIAGSWLTSGLTGVSGTTTRYSNSPTARAQWVAAIPSQTTSAGDYRVHWWRTVWSLNQPNWLATVSDGHAAAVPWLVEAKTGIGGWVDLGRFRPVGNSLTVEVAQGSTLIGGQLRVDALRVAPLVMVDNGQPGYREEGAWLTSGLTGVDGTSTRLISGTGSCQWRAALPKGRYRVWWWRVGYPTNAATVQLSVSHDGGTASQVLDARATSGWIDLGAYSITGGAGQVRLLRSATGTMRSDAVRWEPLADEVPVTVPAAAGKG